MTWFSWLFLCAATIQPIQLQSEYRVNPTGMDVTRPRLSWVVDSEERAQKQSAYRVLVASSLEALQENRGDLWDSGKIASDRSLHVEYDGAPLPSLTSCWWKVRLWDGSDQPSVWSEPATWSMGLLSEEDWTGEWITVPFVRPENELSQYLQSWIWLEDAQQDQAKIFFRRTLLVDEDLARVEMEISVDDAYRLFINGEEVAADSVWQSLERFTFTPGEELRHGSNLIAVEALNGEGPCAMICSIRLIPVDGSEPRLLDAHDWLCTDQEQEGWIDPGFDATDWQKPVTLASHGENPWGNLLLDRRRPQPAVMLRKDFLLEEQPAQALACVTARGVYELRINGRQVGQQRLAPEWTAYDQRIQYQIHDVTRLLQRGENTVAAVVGEGWYSGRIGPQPWPDVHGENPQFLLSLQMKGAVGRDWTLSTDATWQGTLQGPIRGAGIYDGETIDARRSMPGWDRPGFDDAAWEPVTAAPRDGTALVWQRSQPIEITRTLTPVQCTETAPGVYLFDMGQNMVGVCRLQAEGPAGTVITLRHGERLQEDGTLYTDNLRNAKCVDTFILKGGGRDLFEPRFTYHGFRYVEVTGLPRPPEPGDLAGLVFHNRAREVSRFDSSNALVNQLMENILWSQRGNMMGVPTDCPQRDERLGWSGDIQVFAQTSIFNMDMAAFLAKFVRDLREGQLEDGRFPDFAPRSWVRGTDGFAGAPAWGDAGVFLPWLLYVNYGDRRILEEHFTAARAWVDFIHEKNPDLLWAESRGNDYGDWLNGDKTNIDGFPREEIIPPWELFSTAFFAHSARLTARMAEVLGKAEEARKYDTLHHEIKEKLNKIFVGMGGKIRLETQAGYALMLDLDLLRQNAVEGASWNLTQAVRDYNNHLSTGFQTSHHAMLALSRFGFHDEACRLINLRTPPSWGYMIDQGATTLWERWDGFLAGTGYSDPGMNSFNHFMFGAVGEWVWRHIVGLNPDEAAPGWKHFTVRPRPGPGFTWAEGEYDSVRGVIKVLWRIENGEFRLDLHVPANTTATVYLPADTVKGIRESSAPLRAAGGVSLLREEGGCAVLAVQSGQYSFTAPLAP